MSTNERHSRKSTRRNDRSERDRLLEIFTSPGFLARHDPAHPGNRYLSSARARAILDALRSLERVGDLRRYLEIGCGAGDTLSLVHRALPSIAIPIGVDLLIDPLQRARRAGTRTGLVCADAVDLPFRDASFDAVACSLLFSSVRGRGRRAALGREILRVLRPGGHVVSLDLRYPPGIPGRRVAMGKSRIRRLFSSRPVWTETLGLVPFLARLLAARSPELCGALERLPVLRVYRIAVFQRPEGA